MTLELTFCSFVSDEPEGDWGYQLDDYGIRYGAGWWPFHDSEAAADNRKKVGIDTPPEYSVVRLLAGSDFCAGNQTYVLLVPMSNGAEARITVMHHRQGLGGMCGSADVRYSQDFSTFQIGPCPDAIRDAVVVRAEKVRLFVLAAIAERDRGVGRPITAHERHNERQASERAVTNAT